MNTTYTGTDVSKLADEDILFDLLHAAKAGVKMYATALTEAASDPVREVLKKQLLEAIDIHERTFTFAQKKGLYQAYDLNSQVQQDLKNAQQIIDMQ